MSSAAAAAESKRKLLVMQLKEVVHALLNANAAQDAVVMQDSDGVLRLLWLVERIVEHGLKNVAFFGATTAWHFLQQISVCLPGAEPFLNHVSTAWLVLVVVSSSSSSSRSWSSLLRASARTCE